MTAPPESGSHGRHRAPDAVAPEPAAAPTLAGSAKPTGSAQQPSNGQPNGRQPAGQSAQVWNPWAGSTAPAPVSPAVQTIVIPPVRDHDQTAVIPATPPAAGPGPGPARGPVTGVAPTAPRTDETSLMGIVPPAPVVGPEEHQPRPEPKTGEQVVPLRAVRTKTGGYRSIHSALTRTTLGTAVRTTVRGAGELLITLGVIVLVLAAYEVWGKAAVVASHQEDLDRELEEAWAGPQPTATESPEKEAAEPLGPPPGGAIARLYLPRIDKHWVVVEGVDLDDIRYAPGRYPTGAMPGEIGNFAIAGHRNPATFWDLDKVSQGDAVVVETQSTWYTYQVTETLIVLPSAVEVVAPVPGQPGVEPSEAMLTLTTCNPKWDNYERLIVHAQLIEQQPRTGDDDRPAVLGGLGG